VVFLSDPIFSSKIATLENIPLQSLAQKMPAATLASDVTSGKSVWHRRGASAKKFTPDKKYF
jgi:hypothetical protein